jgi:hypothetical protein
VALIAWLVAASQDTISQIFFVYILLPFSSRATVRRTA